MDPSLLDELSSAEVVLDGSEWLRKPTDLYFRDSVTLAQRFGGGVTQHLIDRPEGLWPALAAAGVRNLSDAVTTEIVEQTLLEGGGELAERLWASRRRLVVRVLSRAYDDAATRLDDLQEAVQLQRAGNLLIRHTIEADGVDHTSDPFKRGALFLKDERQLLWVEDGPVEPTWLEVAHELVRALDVDADVAPGITSVLRGVLGAPSVDVAMAELDELGFPALDEWEEVHAEPHVSGGLGGTAADRPEMEDNPRGDDANDEGLEVGDQATAEPVQEEGEPESNGAAEADKVASDDESESRRRQGGGGGEPGEGGASGGSSGSSSSRQSKLRSYVSPAGSPERPEEAQASADAEVDRAAVDAVLAYERQHGRDPQEIEHDNPGYDVRSEAPSGEVRYIEVKGTAVRWGEQGVAISSRQYLEGANRREDFWLYVVDHALSEPRVHPIQDPVSQIDQYLFDDGWREVSEKADVVRTELAPLHLPQFPERIIGAVPFREPETELSPNGWISTAFHDRSDDWFAVRIKGDAVGLRYRGGIAIIQPIAGEPEPDDRLLIQLKDRNDPDTDCSVAIRLWVPDTNDDGSLLRIRLFADGGVGPMTVDDRSDVVVLGEVVHMLDQSELEDLGYLLAPSGDS